VVDADARKYLRLGSTSTLLALRLRGYYSGGDNPGVFYFGGNMELRGYQYLGFAGNPGFFGNVEIRFPIVNLAATPIGILGPIRGTLFFGAGGAKVKGETWQFGTGQPGVSYVNDQVFGEAVSGYHLIDGRASYGLGLQLFFLGYPLHFDWSRVTDLKKSAPWKFDFWLGFDF
jgi:outer membrane protein assembly factor BamA